MGTMNCQNYKWSQLQQLKIKKKLNDFFYLYMILTMYLGKLTGEIGVNFLNCQNLCQIQSLYSHIILHVNWNKFLLVSPVKVDHFTVIFIWRIFRTVYYLVTTVGHADAEGISTSKLVIQAGGQDDGGCLSIIMTTSSVTLKDKLTFTSLPLDRPKACSPYRR